MAPPIDTAQRRAEALIHLLEGYEFSSEPCAVDVQYVMKALQQARREALEEAVKVANENKHNGISRVLFALDRLREGVEGFSS